jgi:hypothetical protein
MPVSYSVYRNIVLAFWLPSGIAVRKGTIIYAKRHVDPLKVASVGRIDRVAYAVTTCGKRIVAEDIQIAKNKETSHGKTG